MSLAGIISIGIVVIGATAVLLGLHLFRGRRQSTDPTCPKCRYDLAGLLEAGASAGAFEPITCPECGHTPRAFQSLFRRKRRPFWLVLSALGLALILEPIVFGNARRIYPHLSDATIARLHADSNDPYARDIVQGRIGVPSTTGTIHYSTADTRTLAEGAIRRIELGNAEGRSDSADPLDIRILQLNDERSTDAAFSARVARAMPPLFGHADVTTVYFAVLVSCDRHDPRSTLPAAVAATNSRDWRVRRGGVQALLLHAQRGHSDDAAFVALLDDENPSVRFDAAHWVRVSAIRVGITPNLREFLQSLEPQDEFAMWVRDLAVLTTMRGDELLEACKTGLHKGLDTQRFDVLRVVGHRPWLFAELFPNWRSGDPGAAKSWIADQRTRPIDEVLEELGFE